MKDELSFEHSLLAYSCESCHKPWIGVSNESCIGCHENSIHFVNKDLSEIPKHPVKRVTCIDCHKEHRGKVHNIKLVGNLSCLECHPADFMMGRMFKIAP